MDWKQVRKSVQALAHRAPSQRTATTRFADEETIQDSSRGTSDRVRTWRRRVLQKKGVRIHRSMGADAGRCTLAMLDQDGMVVSWYDRANCGDEDVLDHHFSQFYVPTDIASNIPSRDLHLATIAGGTTQFGWRRRADGRVYWATTVIKVMTLRSGQLQGFSCITRRSNASLQTAGAGTDSRPTAITDAESRRAGMIDGSARRAAIEDQMQASSAHARYR